MVHEERLPAAARSQHELVAVGDDAALHRQVGDVDMQRLAADAVRHADAESRGRVPVVGLPGEEAHRLLDERVERFFRRKVRRIARYARPEQRRAVCRVVTRHTAHRSQLAPHVVPYPFQFLPVVAPRHHVAVGADGFQPLRVSLVQVFLDPLAVDGVLAAVPRERLHVPRRLFEAEQFLVAVADKHVLVVDVVAGKQQSQRGGERQAAVRAVGRKTLVAGVGGNLLRQVIQIGERMQAENFIPDHHAPRVEPQIFVYGRFRIERQITVQQTAHSIRSDDLFGSQSAQLHKAALAEDTFSLADCIQKAGDALRIAHFLRYDEAAAQRREGAPATHLFFRRLRNEQITRMMQIGTFVEMAFEAAREESRRLRSRRRLPAVFGEEILLMYDRIIGQHAQCLRSCPMQGFVFVLRQGEQLRQCNLESHRDIGVFADDAVLFDAQQRKPALQADGLKQTSHGSGI